MRHFISLSDVSAEEIEAIFGLAADLKAKLDQGTREPLLAGHSMALIFERPSLRTRASFEAGMAHLGGSSLFLGSEAGWGSRESPEDFGRILSQYVDVIVVRAGRHETVENLARHSSCPVINGLTDTAHPCQALADLFTLRQRLGPLNKHTLAYVGDANNVARSLALGCGKLGMRMAVASPKEYTFSPDFLAQLKRDAPHMKLTLTNDPAKAVRGAAAIYTDVWASMGQEAEAAERRRHFAPYQVNAQLMANAPSDAVFMHCLPAHRGEEVTDEVIDSPKSIVVAQAANRMHVQKGILVWLLGAKGKPYAP